MQIELSRLITATGQAISEAQRAVAAHAIANYFTYFEKTDSAENGLGAYTPNTADILIPPVDGSGAPARVAVPLVTMAHHNAMGLRDVRIKLSGAASVDTDEKVLLDLTPSTSDGAASAAPRTELELCFRCGEPPEGTARVNTELNKLL
ncbi:MAG TPA: DUF2589 domain-containing protein [Candidatus Agathobaculum pullicola]|uniref:DUF2589 domain-containing protein n=1 Tax=Candidatus Agathobaculum pullicola TaxID=2838426 RepID=UPI001FA32355|nr:DUF2589 domain-containing protein [Candidatus Agathobaculum pullicola]